MRAALNNRRPSLTFEVTHGLGKHPDFAVSIGTDDAGTIREVFVSGHPSDTMDNVRDSAILLSLALQYGCPLETIAHALTRDDHDRPATVIGSVVAGVKEIGGVPSASAV